MPRVSDCELHGKCQPTDIKEYEKTVERRAFLDLRDLRAEAKRKQADDERKIEEAIAALEPFARENGAWTCLAREEDRPVFVDGVESHFTVGDLRRAAKALAILESK